MRQRQRLGIDTDVWALVEGDDNRIKGGDYRPHIYWTKAEAKRRQKIPSYQHCRLLRVRIVEVEPKA